MEIRLAKTAGFCFGVNRAVELTYGLLNEGHKVATLGPLIHNPHGQRLRHPPFFTFFHRFCPIFIRRGISVPGIRLSLLRAPGQQTDQIPQQRGFSTARR